MAAPLCTRADVDAILSVSGLNARTDDDAATVAYGIEVASATVREYLSAGYADDQLLASAWVRHRTAEWAAQWYCRRRGDPVPESIADAVRMYYGEPGEPGRMEMVRKGSLDVPDAVRIRAAVPGMSNVHIHQGPAGNVTVVERQRSTGAVGPYSPRYDPAEPRVLP